MKVASDFARPALASLYEVAGRFVLLDFSDRVTAESVQRFLDRWKIVVVTPGEQQIPHARIHCTLGELVDPPTGLEEFPLGDEINGYATDTSYQIFFTDSIVAADEGSVVNLSLGQPLQANHPELAQIVSHALSAALRRCGVFELHSGAVVDQSTGKALLICGPSGSGKSTLTLQLAASGWSYLSDDVVLLRGETAAVKATGLRRFFALTRETAEKSGLAEINTIFDSGKQDSGKLPLVPEDLFPAGLVEECRPAAIVFPSITGDADSILRELSPAETMTRLIRLCPWSCYDRAVARSFLDMLARLVKQSISYDLYAGNDLIGDSSYTSDFMATTLEH